MRILDNKSNKKLDNITIFLTESEIKQLIGYAEQLLATPSEDHHHLSSTDYKKEITLCIYGIGMPGNFNPRCQKLITNDE